MSGSKVNNYSTTFTSLTWMQLAIDYARPGYNAIELTNMSTTAKPNIGAGSLCECGGALYQFSTEEPISTTGLSTTDQTYFVELVPSSSQCTAQFSTIVPTYRTDYHGWYSNSTSNHRIVGYTLISSGNYYNKTINIKTNIIYNSTTQGINLTAAYSTIFYGIKYCDILNEYSTATGKFTPVQAGLYYINAKMKYVRAPAAASNGIINFEIQKTGSSTESYSINNDYVWSAAGWGYMITNSINIYLSTSDSIEIAAYGSTVIYNGYGYSTAEPYLFISKIL